MIKVLLVDDQSIVRQGLHMNLELEADIEVVGEASNGQEALDQIQTLAPDVVVMDIVMPEMDGFAATEAVHTRCPRSAVVILSIYDDVSSRVRAQLVGAAAFVAKHEAIERLLVAIRQVASSSWYEGATE